MNASRRVAKLLLIAVFSLIALPPAVAAIGLAPSSVAVEDVLLGGYAEKSFRVYNTDPSARVFSFKVEGALAEWASVYPQDVFVVDSGELQEVKVVVQPPSDAATGAYEGSVSVKARPQNAVARQGASAEVETNVLGHLLLTVTNARKAGLAVNSVESNSVEERMPVFLKFDLTNPGNVRARPLFSVDIYGPGGRLLKSVSKQDVEILPTKSVAVTMHLPTEDLPAGEYVLAITVSLGGEKVFERAIRQEILEAGALSRQGQVVEVRAPPWAEVGGYARVEAVFRNLGTLASTAKISGEVLVDGKSVAPLSGDELDVLPGQTVALPAIVKITRPGRHVARVAVLFAGKLTGYTEAVINVNPPPGASAGVGGAAYAVLLAFGALAVLAYFFREKIPKIKLLKKWKPGK